jgi:hypothetical protein
MREFLKVGLNGQLEFDFDCLLLITSVEFVRVIKEELEDIKSKIVDVRVLKKTGNVIVRISYADLILYEFSYGVSNGYIGRSSISLSQVETFLKLTGRKGLR